jgi:hypothetical protein
VSNGQRHAGGEEEVEYIAPYSSLLLVSTFSNVNDMNSRSTARDGKLTVIRWWFVFDSWLDPPLEFDTV